MLTRVILFPVRPYGLQAAENHAAVVIGVLVAFPALAPTRSESQAHIVDARFGLATLIVATVLADIAATAASQACGSGRGGSEGRQDGHDVGEAGEILDFA